MNSNLYSPVVSELGLFDFSGFESGCGIRCKPVLFQHFHGDAADVGLSFHVRAKITHLADFVQFIGKGVAWIPHVCPVYFEGIGMLAGYGRLANGFVHVLLRAFANR